MVLNQLYLTMEKWHKLFNNTRYYREWQTLVDHLPGTFWTSSDMYGAEYTVFVDLILAEANQQICHNRLMYVFRKSNYV